MAESLGAKANQELDDVEGKPEEAKEESPMAEKIGESLAAKVANKVEDEKEEDQVAKLQKQQTVIAEPDEASEQPKSEAGEENGK